MPVLNRNPYSISLHEYHHFQVIKPFSKSKKAVVKNFTEIYTKIYMIGNPFLKLTLTGSTSYALFSRVSGLEPNALQPMMLLFSEGRVFGVDFVRLLANPPTDVNCEMALELWSENIRLQDWELYLLRKVNYSLNQSQSTEEYLELDLLELHCKMR